MRSCQFLQSEFDHGQDICLRQLAGSGQLHDPVDAFFDFFQVFLPEQLHILRGYVAALGLNGVKEAVLFQLFVGPAGGHEADAQILGKPPDGGEHFVFLQGAADDLILDLRIDLLVDRRTAFVVDENMHAITSQTVYL